MLPSTCTRKRPPAPVCANCLHFSYDPHDGEKGKCLHPLSANAPKKSLATCPLHRRVRDGLASLDRTAASVHRLIDPPRRSHGILPPPHATTVAKKSKGEVQEHEINQQPEPVVEPVVEPEAEIDSDDESEEGDGRKTRAPDDRVRAAVTSLAQALNKRADEIEAKGGDIRPECALFGALLNYSRAIRDTMDEAKHCKMHGVLLGARKRFAH